jgi:hypothetical protein
LHKLAHSQTQRTAFNAGSLQHQAVYVRAGLAASSESLGSHYENLDDVGPMSVGRKGFIASLLSVAGHRLLLVTCHLPMSDAGRGSDWNMGLAARTVAAERMMDKLRAKGWLDSRTAVILTGDMNFRVDDAVGEQLTHVVATSPALAGFSEPILPRYYTCRFATQSEVTRAAGGALPEAFDECRSGRSAAYEIGSVVPRPAECEWRAVQAAVLVAAIDVTAVLHRQLRPLGCPHFLFADGAADLQRKRDCEFLPWAARGQATSAAPMALHRSRGPCGLLVPVSWPRGSSSEVCCERWREI